MRPLVFVHGFLGGGDQWHPQASLGASRPLIALDLPGFGARASEPPLADIAAYAGWCLETLTALGYRQVDLIGHSMGGMIVQEMVHQAPSRIARLVLYATGASGDLPGRFESIATSMDRARSDGAETTARRIAATWFRAREEAPEYSACAEIAARAGLPAILAGLAAMQSWSGASRLPQIACPTLVAWGDCDRTYPWSQIQELWHMVPDSRLAVIPDCAHAVHLECPEIFNATVARFLAS